MGRWAWLRDSDVVDPRDDADELRAEIDALDFEEASVARLELSGTGLEAECFRQVAAVLSYFADDRRPMLSERPDLALAAEVAARADLLEYGCALRVAWPTKAGQAWLADYEAWTAESDA